MKLTLPQQDIYFEQQVYPNSPIYTIGAKIEIKGNVDFETLNKAYKKLINQHDAYRSYVVHKNDTVTIEVIESFDKELAYVDFSQKSNAQQEANDFMQQKMITPFSLHEDKQLHDFILIKIHDTFHYLFSKYHHIITDGWGTSLMFQRLVKNYNELLEQEKIQTTYSYTYQDFVIDDKEYQTSEQYLKDKTYWVEKFKHLPETLINPKDNIKTKPKSSRKTLLIKRDIYNQLIQIGKQNGGSTFHVILGILFLYFGKKHQNDDFAIGLPVLNRGKSIFKKTVGLFMGVTPFKMSLNFEQTFGELIKAVRSQLRLDYRHQRFPLGKLIKELKLYTEKKRLFDITLSYEKQNYANHFLNTQTSVIPLSHQAERVALAIYIREFDDTEDVLLDFDYNHNYFEQKEIDRVVTHIENLINKLVELPNKPLHSYSYLAEEEKQTLLKAFNTTHFPYPEDKTVIHQIIEEARKHPAKIAIADGTKQYTYAEVDTLSNAIACYILKSSTISNEPIAVLMKRSADLIITIIGIIKAGKAFIPLDPDFPKARLLYILNHSEATHIIGDEEFRELIAYNGKYTTVQTLLEDKQLGANVEINYSTPEKTAYIIYTSGSTGKPKGVAIAHKSLANFVRSMKHILKIENTAVLFSVTTPSFDISILEFFVPLVCGSSVFIASQELLQEPSKTIEAIEQNKATIIQATPSFYQMLFNAGWKGNKELKVLCGGDLLSTSLAEKLVSYCRQVWNMYGPTETTIWSTSKEIKNSSDASTIGKPIHNTEIYILDKNLQLLPIGSVGTIYISGAGVAQGYYKNSELTDERFIDNPFLPAKKMYNTGDIGKWNEEGEIIFLGRNDYQVKIRGYRIELGAIETRLEEMLSIKQAVVVAKKNKNQEAFLIAYVIRENEEFSPSITLQNLRKVLPSYMIPNTIIALNEFPLTANKKVDRKKMTLLELPERHTIEGKVEPISILEKQLSKIFRETLEIDNIIGIHENFFELGGHSLNAVKVVSAVEKEMQCKIYLETIFNNPTIYQLANFISKNKLHDVRYISVAPKSSHYPITIPQYSIWLASLQSERSVAYNMFTAYTINGEINKAILETAFHEIIEKYEILRTNFIEVEGRPFQKINESVSFTIDEFQTTTENDLRDYANREFDLESDTLLRIGVFKNDDKKDTLVFVTHHIIMDGWSLEVLITELKKRYIKIAKKQQVNNEKPAIQFKDYTIWLQEIESKNRIPIESFWKSYLKNYEWNKLINYDYTQSSKDYTGKFYKFNWNAKFLKSLQNFATQNKITLHTLLITAFNIILYRLYKRNDICMGTINSGRVLAELNEHIGMFVKTLPLRTIIESNQKVSEMLAKVQKDMVTIDQHQDIPHSILNNLRFEAILVLQNPTYDYSTIRLLPNLELTSKTIDAKYNRVPLLLDFSIKNDLLHGSVHYDTEKFAEETIGFLIAKLELLLTQMIENIDATVDFIDINLEFEKEELLDIDFNF
jgi:amino acid adenylation domain-containing protein